MADAVAVPRLRSENPFLQLARLVPGIVLLGVIGYSGKLLEHAISRYSKAHHLTAPNLEYVLWAIILGMLIANTVGVPQLFRAGIATYEFWLKAGIVLLGSRFLLGDVMKLGSVSLAMVLVELVVSLSFMAFMGRVFKLNPKLTTLLAVGSSVCGVSAIIATQSAIEADEQESSFAIAAILALGAIALFTFPLIGHALHMSDQAFGLWSGLAVDNTAEATAAGALYSDVAGKMAVLAKTTRNTMLGFVVLGYAIHWATKGQAPEIKNKGMFLVRKFPKFVLGLLFISLLATYQVFTKEQLGSLSNLSRWAFLLSFAGVGLRTDLREMKRQGMRPFAVGLIGELIIAVFTLGMVLGVGHLLHY